MFFYLEFLILRLSDMLLIDSDTVSEFGFTNSSLTGVFFTTCETSDNVKKIRTSQEKCAFKLNVLSTFLNVYEIPKSRLAQHSHLLSGRLKTRTCFWENSALVKILLRLGACCLLFITLSFSKSSILFHFKHSIDLPIIS